MQTRRDVSTAVLAALFVACAGNVGGPGPSGLPTAPTGVAATAGVHSASVTWAAPASSGGSAITGYTVLPSPATSSAVVTVTGTAATVTGLANGTAYTFTVSASNALGTGPPSAPSAPVTTPDVPGAPTSVNAVAGNQSVALSWTASTTTGGEPITGYTVVVSPPAPSAAFNVTGTTATFTGLTNGTAYTFTVAAVNAVGTGPASAPSAPVTPSASASVPSAPSGVVATADVRSATVTWTAPTSSGGSVISGYTVFISPPTASAVITVTGTTAAVTGLANGTAYTFSVTASNATGPGAVSSPSAPVTTPDVPGAPTSPVAVAGDQQVSLSWTAPASNGGRPITSYTVVVSPPAPSVVFNLTGTTATVTGLSNGTAYTFQVYATNVVGNGPSSSASSAVTPAPGSGQVFPLSISASKNGLVDASGRPFLMQGDAAWSGIAELSEADAIIYLDDRQSRGFNTLLVNLVEHRFTSHNPPQADAAGDRPFTNNSDLSTTNDAYFQHADWFLQQALARGMLVLLAPAYMGYKGSTDGWIQEMTSTGTAKLDTYGRYLGARYANVPNILWVNGGDYTPSSSEMPLVTAIVNGIKAAGDTHLHTAHWGGEPSFNGPQPSWIDVDTVYVNSPPANYTFMVDGFTADNGVRPIFFIEGWYENEHQSTRLMLRSDMYQPLLSGEVGFVYGIFPIWSFWSGASGNDYANDGNYPNWKAALGAPGGADATRAKQFFGNLAWQNLTPDANHVVVTAGYGSWGSSNYVLAASTSDRHLAVAYFTNTMTITVDMSRMSGSTTTRWFDPSNGTFTAISGSPFANTGSKSFTPPGSNSDGSKDWVLLLEAP